MDRMFGAISAAPTPWRMRAVISTPGLGARAHAAEVRTNTAMPMANTSRRPNGSPRRPPAPTRTAVLMATPATIHSIALSPACRPCWIDGSATFTMKKSRTNMNVPNMRTVSAAQERPDGAWTGLGRVRVAVMPPSLRPPVTGESRGLEDRPADLGAVAVQVRFGERDQVILADRAVHADGPLGDHRAERAVGLVHVTGRPGVQHHRRLDA